MPASEADSLILKLHARPVSLEAITDPDWFEQHMRRQESLWHTQDRRVLATLWWYLVSPWVVGPTLVSLTCGTEVLSADFADLTLHMTTDERVTGATSHRVLLGDDPVDSAAASLRDLFEHVIPIVADFGHMRERPLWAIATDALANRLLWLGRATAHDLDGLRKTTQLLSPLCHAIGYPLPQARYADTERFATMHTHRCSCCLIYQTPGANKCASCPRGGELRRQI